MTAKPFSLASIRQLADGIALVICATLFAPSASAEIVRVTLGWEPAAQPTISGYEIHLGGATGVYDQHFDVGMPSLLDGSLRSQIDLDDTRNNFLSISAYDANGSRTPFSEELLVLAAVVEPEPEPEPEPAPEPEPEPEPAPEPAPEPVPATDVALTAAVTSALSLGVAVDGDGPVDGLPRVFADYKYVRKHLAYGSEYVICDLHGDGVKDLVLGNLLSNTDSPRSRREPGRVLVFDRRPTSGGGTKTTLRKLRADFMDKMDRFVETHVACGDIDGDGLQELIVSSGKGGNNTLQIMDDVTTGFAFFKLPESQKGVMRIARDILGAGGNGEMFTAAGDIDDDGADEIIVSFKRPLADQLLILDDASRDFEPMQDPNLDTGYLTTAALPDMSNFRGVVVPVAVDSDGDGVDEIVIVYANDDGLSFQLYDDAGADFERLR